MYVIDIALRQMLKLGTGIVTSITQKEKKLKEGNLYFISYSQKVKKKKKLILVMSTPAAPLEVHFDRNSISSHSKESKVRVYVGMTTTGTLGTPIPVLNTNGTSVNVSPVTVFHSPTGTVNPGYLAFEETVGDKEGGGSHFMKSPLILRQGMNYMMEIESKGDNNVINTPFEFFIHDPTI